MSSTAPAEVCRTEVNFVDGLDVYFDPPRIVRSAGLKHRFAVIQETFRRDSVDMYFDEPMWRCLFRFAAQYSPGSALTVLDNDGGGEESADEWVARFDRLPRDDRVPTCLVVRQRGAVVLCVAPEFWNQVGGPMPYADSFTYSIFSNESIRDRVLSFLRAAPESVGWQIAESVLKPEHVPRWKLWLRQVFSRL